MKKYLSSQELLEMSYQLGVKIIEDKFQPTMLLGLWRGGTPIGIAVHELLFAVGNDCFHKSIKTTRIPFGDDFKINIIGLNYICRHLKKEDKILIIDDIFDSGRTMEAIVDRLIGYANREKWIPDYRIATIFYKPNANKTTILPDYYIETTEDWIVFPHEISNLTEEELKANKPYIYNIIKGVLFK